MNLRVIYKMSLYLVQILMQPVCSRLQLNRHRTEMAHVNDYKRDSMQTVLSSSAAAQADVVIMYGLNYCADHTNEKVRDA